jgi:hypothetical protein
MKDAERLRLFVRRADELRETRMMRTTTSVGMTLSFNQAEGTKVALTQPDEDDLRSTLLTLRQSVMKNEPVYLHRIHNLCYRYTTSEVLRGYLREARSQWTQSVEKSAGGMRLVLNGQDWSPEFVADVYINGYYFHNNEGKADLLARLGNPERALSKYQFLNFVVETASQVLVVSNIIREVGT